MLKYLENYGIEQPYGPMVLHVTAFTIPRVPDTVMADISHGFLSAC